MPHDVEASVIGNRHLSSDYHVLALAAPGIARDAAPGQFVMVKPAVSGGPLLRRPFSVFEILRDGDAITGLSLLSKRVGPTTALLFEAGRGDRVRCLGPLGRAFTPVDPPAAAWLVAGGVGLAPFVTLAESLSRRGTPTRLYYGARRASDLFHLDYFDRLGVALVLTTEDGSRGVRGRVTAPLERDLGAGGAGAVVYACGPEPMLAAVARLAAAAGRPAQVSVERVMGCGLGGCYSCVIAVKQPGRDGSHFVRSCRSGPVFDGAVIDWGGR